MTATTATWAIPYATGTDRVCDGATITQSMAQRVDAILCSFDAQIAFLQDVPCAGVEVAVGLNVVQPMSSAGCSPGIGVPWNAVNYDTDNMANLAFDSSVITMNTPGYYQIGGVCNFFIPPATAGDLYSCTVFSTRPVLTSAGNVERDQGLSVMLKTMGSLNQVLSLAPGNEAEIDMEVCRVGTLNGSPATFQDPTSMYSRWIREL